MIKSETDIKIHEQESLRYESLRLSVLENKPNHGKGNLGLAMFLRQGMLIWMTTLHKYDSVRFSTNKKTHQLPMLPFNVQSEMTRVLANMALLSLGESDYEDTTNGSESYCKPP